MCCEKKKEEMKKLRKEEEDVKMFGSKVYTATVLLFEN